jgi:hypothetical protein
MFLKNLQTILVSPADPKTKDHIIATLGVLPWCTSAWRSVYYRIWRIGSGSSTPNLLLDNTEGLYLGNYAVVGRANVSDVLIEFSGRSIDSGILVREMVRHFTLDGDKVERIAPIALSPRDFVDEWLTHTWSESSRWSESAQLQQWHQKLQKKNIGGEFTDPTLHCRLSPDLWQVGVNLPQGQTPMDRYFLVRWRPPYRFSMVNISEQASPVCNEEDRNADEPRTLFPIQELP